MRDPVYKNVSISIHELLNSCIQNTRKSFGYEKKSFLSQEYTNTNAKYRINIML